jgi:hypothetical protein
MQIKPFKSKQYFLILALCFIVLTLVFILLLGIFSGQSTSVGVELYEDKLAVAKRPQFIDVTQITGIHHSHIQHTGQIVDLIDSTHASACVADFNNDNWVDILFVNGGGQTRFYGKKSWWQEHRQIILYRNNQGQFEDIKGFSPQIIDSGTSCSVADFNGDGLSDIVIGTTGIDLLFKNTGNFTFEEISAFADASQKSWTSHISIADINADGLPDIHLSKFINYRQNQKNLELFFGFSEQHNLQLDAGKFDGLQNTILVNQNDFSFQDQSKALGFSIQPARTLSSAWVDVNQDDLVDLIEHNVGDNPLKTYLQNEEGLFTELLDPRWPLRANNVHYSALGQQINDENSLWIATRPAGLASLVKYAPSFLKDISWQAGIASHERAYQHQWGNVFADLNNDGYADIVIANGSLRGDPFSPQMTIPMPSLCAIRQNNLGSQHAYFETSTCSTQRLLSARTVVKLDYNNDGAMDLLFLANNDFPLLLKNTGNKDQNWVGLLPPNKHSLDITTNGKTLTYAQDQRQALFGTHDQRWHVGLGAQPIVVATLRTVAGKTIHKQTLASNRYYSFDGTKWIPLVKPEFEPHLFAPFAIAQIHLNGLHISSSNLSSLLLNSLELAKSETWLELALALLQEQSQEQLSIAAKYVKMYPEKSALPLYVSLLTHPNSEVSQAASIAISVLEDEYSASLLLAILDAKQPELFCNIANIFTQWLDQEEAVMRGKGRAIPYFIKGVSHSNPKIVNCSAQVLAQAEHINGAYAIMEVLNSANQATLPNLINALGQIRQKEATANLIDIFNKNKRADVLQQTLIALKRLDFNQFETLIQNKREQGIVWLAISSLPLSQSAIVIPESIRNKWLALVNKATFKDFAEPSNRDLYLRLSLHLPSIFTLEDVVDLTELDRTSRYYIDAILNIQGLTPAMVGKVLEQPLNNAQLTTLSAYTGDMASLFDLHTSEQISNVISLWESLSKEQQQDLGEILKAQTFSDFSTVNKEYVLSRCLQNTNGKDFLATLSVMQKQLSLLQTQCDFLRQINKDVMVNSEQLSQIILRLEATQVEFLTDLSGVSSKLNKIVLNKLSSLILYRSDLSQSTKKYWAVSNVASDKLSQTWINKQIELGDNELLKQLLIADKIDLLGDSNKLETLLQNSLLSSDVKFGISGVVKAMRLRDRGI